MTLPSCVARLPVRNCEVFATCPVLECPAQSTPQSKYQVCEPSVLVVVVVEPESI